jgi:hypothetical protein
VKEFTKMIDGWNKNTGVDRRHSKRVPVFVLAQAQRGNGEKRCGNVMGQ